MNETREEVIAAMVAERPELWHVVCCRDENAALCGTDASDLPFTDGTGEQFCLVCDDLDQPGMDVCPLTKRSCP